MQMCYKPAALSR